MAAQPQPVPREFLWVLFLTLPVVALLIEPALGHFSLSEIARYLAAMGIDTLVIGLALQASSEKVQKLTPGFSPLAQTALIGVVGAVVALAASGLIMPALVRLCPSVAGHEWSLAVRGVAIAAVYLTAGCSLARARTRVIDARLQAHALSRSTLEARLAALQARTNPHFLFNSLASISALVAIDPERASVMLERMAGLFRYSLESGTRARASVREELEAARDYIDVEEMRLGDRLSHSFEVDDDVLDAEALPMLLQPLVENAIFHGVETRSEGGLVSVRGSRTGNEITLTVQDNGPGESQRKGAGTSLASLRDRLALTYGTRASVETRHADGFVVTVRLPT